MLILVHWFQVKMLLQHLLTKLNWQSVLQLETGTFQVRSTIKHHRRKGIRSRERYYEILLGLRCEEIDCVSKSRHHIKITANSCSVLPTTPSSTNSWTLSKDSAISCFHTSVSTYLWDLPLKSLCNIPQTKKPLLYYSYFKGGTAIFYGNKSKCILKIMGVAEALNRNYVKLLLLVFPTAAASGPRFTVAPEMMAKISAGFLSIEATLCWPQHLFIGCFFVIFRDVVKKEIKRDDNFSLLWRTSAVDDASFCCCEEGSVLELGGS